MFSVFVHMHRDGGKRRRKEQLTTSGNFIFSTSHLCLNRWSQSELGHFSAAMCTSMYVNARAFHQNLSNLASGLGH